MMNGYRPTTTDMTGKGKWQSLSLRDAGMFDQKFRDVNGVRRLTTAWTFVCQDRANRGVSRRLRIRAGKETS